MRKRKRWTTGETENFITLRLWAVSLVVRVPDLRRNWSIPLES
jgi:hypothetical protein